MPKTVAVEAHLDTERAKATIQIVVDGEPLAHVIFDAPELEELLASLSVIRAQMAEGVPLTIDPGSRMLALVDPVWRHPHRTSPEGKALSLRHPGLGWLTFVFPDLEAEAIARYLSSNLPQFEE